MNLLAQQQQKAPQQPAPPQTRAAADMRLNNGPGRSHAPSSDQSSNQFVRSRQPVLRDFPLGKHVSGRGPQPEYQPAPRTMPLPRKHNAGLGFAEPQSLVRKHMLGPMPRRVDPPSLPERQPSTGQNSDLKDFVASRLPSLAKSEAISPASASNAPATKPDTAVASSGGFDALEAASAHDAKGSARNIGMSQEWGQLARKSTNRPFLSKNLWPGQSNITISRPQRVDTWDTEQPPSEQPPSEQPSSEQLLSEQPSSAPRAGKNKKKDTVADKLSAPSWDTSISSAPPRQGGHDHDHEMKGRWDTPKREKKPDKKRGGRRSQQASRFEDDDGADDYDEYQEKRRQKELRKAQREAERTEPIPIILPELISITALANALKIKPDDFLVQLGELGFEGVTLDSLMAGETAALVAQEYGYEPTVDAGDAQDLKPRPPPEDPSVLPSRPPVVTIMGHVDHGKTTILDYLRQSSVAAQEHGGITQHIGAFSVKLSSGKPITFLDTPGHAAFLTMRQRGANVTDIVVLVVAADDSVKPQTLEALKHARAAKVPIIVAINKIDKDGARIDAVKSDLAKAGLEIEDYGGDVQVVCVSGKTGQGMEDLEENILTLSEILDHRAELDGPAEGWVLESSLKPTGKVATVLVKRGTLRPGDYIAAGLTWAKIRQLRNEAGVDVAEAPPGTPVEILGWKDLPAAGDQVIQSPDEDRAKTAVSYREGLREREKDAAEYEVIAEARKALQEKREREKAASEGDTTVQEALPDEENGTKIVNFVVKGDVHGSVEAVCAAIQELGNHEVRPRVLRSAPGPITEFDVDHAATSKSVLVNFATTTPGHIRRMAEEQGVRILEHTIIYHLVDDIKAKLSEYLNPEVSIRVLGEAEILQVFPVNIRRRIYKNIAGCRVRNGVVGKNNLYRVLRRGEVIFEGKLETLKHVKKDVLEMRKGAECGMGFEEFQDLEVGDQIQAYEEVRTARTLS
ncbi:initiation factor 2 [Xylaria sp. FL0933]|nr:initiation factor 2 [Xylaria sp. FL0933]